MKVFNKPKLKEFISYIQSLVVSKFSSTNISNVVNFQMKFFPLNNTLVAVMIKFIIKHTISKHYNFSRHSLLCPHRINIKFEKLPTSKHANKTNI